METRFVPDAPGAWLVYDLGSLVLALPSEFRAAADAVAATPVADVDGVLAALRASGIAETAPFALLDAEGEGVRLVLRGPATVAVGAETLTGVGAEPWLDRVVVGASVARLTVPGGEWTLALAPTAFAPAAPDASVAAPAVPAAAPAVPLPGIPAPPPAPGSPASAPVPPPPPLLESPLLEPHNEITEIPETSVPSASVPPAPTLGEHDGHTVLASDLPVSPPEDRTVVVDEIAQLRAKRSAGLAVPVVATAHAPGPALSLELPDGSREPLDAVLVIGRAPVAPEGGRVVRLAGDGDISRTHARVAVEGGTVVVTDLGSRNGTVVRIPGRPAQRLREHEPTPVLVGTVVDFGGGVELSVREG